MSINIYYVYELIDPRTALPFYVGKGSGDRCYDHLNGKVVGENRFKDAVIAKIRKEGLEPIVVLVEENLTESSAYKLEDELIVYYGRRCYESLGLLTNICLGKNPPSRKGKKVPLAAIEKLRKRAKDPTVRKQQSVYGKKGWEKIKKQGGWSKHTIQKRTKTRMEKAAKGEYSWWRDMSACHTKEAIKKRSETRKIKGVKYNTNACNSLEASLKTRRTKRRKILQEIYEQYKEPLTFEVLKKAKDSGFKKYLNLEQYTEKELLRLFGATDLMIIISKN